MALSMASTMSSRVIEAVMNNDVPSLKNLRDSGESLACKDTHGDTLLHLAIMAPADRPTIDAFDYLLTLDEIDKDAVNGRNNTALFEAFARDCQSFAMKLIKAGCEIHKLFSDGNSALHLAVQNGWIDVAELLVENGADVDVLNRQGKTPLNIACCFERVDEIWMLLFYGADPNLACCFDICATRSVKAEVQEIFLDCLIGYNSGFKLMTFATLMANGDTANFVKVLKATSNIKYTCNDLPHFCSQVPSFKPTLFRRFLEKYQDVAHGIFTVHYLAYACAIQANGNLSKYVKNLIVLFQSPISKFVVDEINCSITYSGMTLVSDILHSCVQFDKTPETATSLLCFLMSVGINITVECMDIVYLNYGYCDLFKIMLHMDIVGMRDSQLNYAIPKIIYDIKQTRRTIVRNIVAFNFVDQDICRIFNYFALTKRARRCVFHNYECDYNLEDKLPPVPSLVELARNSLHEYIVNKFKLKTSRQFYTLIKRLPIATIHKEILSYERQLYFFD